MIKSYCQYPEYNRYYQKKGWVVESIGETSVLIRPLVGFGSIIKIKRADPNISFGHLNELAKRYKTFLIRIDINIETSDPLTCIIIDKLVRNGYYPSAYSFCPTRTIHLDLTQSEDQILAQTRSDVRRYLRKNSQSDIHYKYDGKIDDYYSLLFSVSKQKGFSVSKWEDFYSQWGHFGDDMKLVLGYSGSNLVGGSMTLCRDGVAHGIFMTIKKELAPKHFSYPLLWESICAARRAGCEVLDFDGIYDPRFNAHQTWKGLTMFKKKFGGKEVEFLEPFVKMYPKPLNVFAKLKII